MAAAAAPTAVELKKALDANMRRVKVQAEHLGRIQRNGAWKLVPEARARLDELLDERNALRARR